MHAKTFIARTLCTLSLISLTACLTACNWDAAKEKSSTAATDSTVTTPSSTDGATAQSLNTVIVVEAGSDTNTLAGSYTVTGGSASSNTFGTQSFTTNSLESEPLTVGVSVSNADASQYAVVAFEPATGQTFACRSGTWSSTEVASVQAQLRNDVPTCGTGVTINIAKGSVTISKLTLAALSGDAKTLILGTAMKWASTSTSTATSSLPAVGTVVEGTVADAEHTHSVTSGESSGLTVGTLALHVETQFTDAFNVAVAADQADLSHYVLAVSKTATGAVYACAGGTWAGADKLAVETALGTGVLPACPAGITSDVGQGVLKMSQITLSTNAAVTEDADKTLVLSANLDWTIDNPVASAEEPQARE